MVQNHLIASSKTHAGWLKDEVARDIHRFNVFQVDDPADLFDCRPYNRPGYYKISLHYGHNRLSDEKHSFEFEGAALVFAHPDVVYGMEHLGVQKACYFCVFTEDFFERFTGIGTYEVFSVDAAPVILLTDAQQLEFTYLFQQMTSEIAQDFHLKYDLLRALVMQLILKAIKLRPIPVLREHPSNATKRVTERFMELLEHQFPITSPVQRMALRHPVEFAQQLSMHVNSLNRMLKKLTGKTTSQLISERTLRDAQELLIHTTWNIVEIAWCLGYEDVSHFIKSFKKYGGTTPAMFRKTLVA
ncbi:AraC family transcriptional activator of pobA [Mucilaginibacter sp. UYP25]|uniref:helix-turn-helix domain-containing protein n=1 Tax=unclassified Mucilaginibacter TaxID=2617802 RepID=UPI003392E126